MSIEASNNKNTFWGNDRALHESEIRLHEQWQKTK